MAGEQATDRKVFAITGEDRETFLQGLVTNDIGLLKIGIVYAALLSPQGKYLADFFLVPAGQAVLLDVKDTIADDLVRRLSMYRLRADVQIAPSPIRVSRGLGPAPDDALMDPRHAELGWRVYSEDEADTPEIDWDNLRVQHCIPETGIELIPDETFILEAGFERLNGVDFRKGCYVGQEVTARMKHKTDLRKGLARVVIDGPVEPGAEITSAGKTVGKLHTRSGDRAIAYLRFDRAEGEMQAGAARVTWDRS